MKAYFSFSLILTSFLLLACGGMSNQQGQCGRHDQCEENQACLAGICVEASLDEPLDVSGLEANQWFTYSDGSCVSDDQCGPWACHESHCQDPTSAGRNIPNIGNFAYWDGSCLTQEDCGEWRCINNWCSDPEFSSNQPSFTSVSPEINGTGNGQSCLGDSDCGGDECIVPGYCHSNRGSESMTFTDFDGFLWYSYSDGSCNYDTDCGPHVCYSGWCSPPEQANRALPNRDEFEYYDSSCSSNADCPMGRGWICQGGWCGDPLYLYQHSPDPFGEGIATNGELNGYEDPHYEDPHYYEDPYYQDPYYEDPYGQDSYYGPTISCTMNSQCGPGSACVQPGTCQSGLLMMPMNVESITASGHYTNLDGKCEYDNECGPWMCSTFGYCSSPDGVGRVMQSYESYTYFDTSCLTDNDCGGWTCITGWCTDPNYAGP